MKVICPKCQYENQCNSSQVFCARCATMIDVRSARESRPETQMGLDLTPGRPKSRLPFAATPGSQAGDEPYQNQGSVPIRPVREDRGRRDAYATRIGDDFDDLLEISPPVLARPRPETAPLLEDKLYETNTTGWSGVDLPAGRPVAGNIGDRERRGISPILPAWEPVRESARGLAPETVWEMRWKARTKLWVGRY